MRYLLLILLFTIVSLTSFSQSNNQTVTIMDTLNSKILGLRTTVYMVANLAEAKLWYAKAFSTQPYFDEPFYVGFNIGGYELGLLPEEKPTIEKPESSMVYWGVENIDENYNHFIDVGAIEHEKPNNVGGDLMVASVRDPWGNIIGLIYNPHFKLPE